MRKTLGYYFKNRFNIILIISFIAFLITFFYLVDARFVYTYEYINEHNEYIEITKAQNSPFALLTTIAAVLSTFVITFEFYFKMKRVSVDQIYALPIKREKFYLSKLILCYLEVVIPTTICFILSIIMISMSVHIFNMIYFIPYYFGLMFLIAILITSLAFVYTRANTFFDGLINILGYTFILVLISNLIFETFELRRYNIRGAGSFFLYSPVDIFTTWMNLLFKGVKVETEICNYFGIGIFVLFGLIALFLFIKLNKEEPSENTTQISNSLFSYKTIIPIYSIVFCSMSILSGGILALAFASIFTYLMFVLYKRSFKLTKRDYMLIAIYIIIGICLGVCFSIINDSIVSKIVY